MMDAALQFTLQGCMLLLGIALFCGLLRLVRGPSLPDRVVALDLIAYIVIGIIAVDAIQTQHDYFLRGAIALALIAFLGTISFAFYLQLKSGARP